MKKIRFYCILLTLVFITLSCSSSHQFPVEKGIIVISEQSLTEEIIGLNGDWEFYWQELISPGDFSNRVMTGYVRIPSDWSENQLDMDIPAHGYATYRLKIVTEDAESLSDEKFILRIYPCATTYKAWWNGILIATNGQMGTNIDSNIPHYKKNTIEIDGISSTNELVLQIANFRERRGGELIPIKFGIRDVFYHFDSQRLFLEWMVIGGCFFLFIYYLTGLIKREWSWLIFVIAVFHIILALRVMNSGELLFQELFPNIPWIWQMRLDTITAYIGLLVFILYVFLFVNDQVPFKRNRLIFWGTAGLIIGFFLIVVLSPVNVFTSTEVFYVMITAPLLIISLWLLFRQIIRNFHEMFWMTFASLIMFLSVIYDMVWLVNMRNGELMSIFGILLFLVVQTIAVSRYNTLNFSKVKRLSAVLEKQKQDLIRWNESLETTTQSQEKELDVLYEELIVNERRYRQLFDSMRDGFILIDVKLASYNDPSYIIANINAVAAHWFGREKQEIIGNNILTVFPEVPDRLIDALGLVSQNGNTYTLYEFFEVQRTHVNLTVYSPLPMQIVVLASDITEQVENRKRQQLEQDFREFRIQLWELSNLSRLSTEQELLDVMMKRFAEQLKVESMLYYRINSEDHTFELVSKIPDSYDYDSKIELPMNVFNRIRDNKYYYICQDKQKLKSSLVGLDEQEYERIISLLNRYGFNEILFWPIYIEDHHEGFIVIVGRNSLAGEWNELELSSGLEFAKILSARLMQMRAESAMRESQENFRQMAENFPAVFFIRERNELVYINNFMLTHWGISPEPYLHNADQWDELIYGNGDNSTEFDYPRDKIVPQQSEFRIKLPDGSIRWVWSRAHDIISPDNGRLKRFGILFDITDRKNAEEKLELSEKKSKELLKELKSIQKEMEIKELQNRFIRVASHEFKTPLSSIRLSAETVERNADKMSPEKLKFYFTSIYDAIDHMTELMNDVLTLEKTKSGRDQLDFLSYDFDKNINRIIREFKVVDNGRHIIRTEIDIDPKKEFITDKRILRLILSNLISNALKYSAEGTTIDIRIHYNDDKLDITVSDEGIGIPQKNLVRIFDAFYRADNVSDIPGTGLGLSILKAALDLLGGSINIRPNGEQGTIFMVEIPNKIEDNDEG